MPVINSAIHKIDKKPDGTPAVLHLGRAEHVESQVRDDLMSQFNESYNATTGKAWGFFHPESGAYPLSGWIAKYQAGGLDFLDFSVTAVEHLCKILEESNLTTGGHAIFCHYRQGMTDYMVIALVQETEALTMTEELDLIRTKRLDVDHIRLAARINLSEWKGNPASKQYVSYLKGKNGKKSAEYFRDFIGVQEGIDGAGETRTLLKAFSDFVESEDLPEESARERTKTLIDYASSQAKIGGLCTLDELSELIDEDNPKAFAEFARAAAYGLSPEIPADKRVLNQFRRFTGRAEGLSISFEAHLVGDKVEYNQEAGTLMIKGLPTQLTEQLKRAAVKE